jgi:hypothetical protein
MDNKKNMKGTAMKTINKRERINTNLGDLIAAISDVVFENSPITPQRAYTLAHLVLMEMLKNASFKNALNDRLHSTSSLLH